MVTASCLCGDVAWEADGPFAYMHHCHCSRCRKSSGAAFGTYVSVPVATFRFTRGADGLRRYASSPSLVRTFCGRCGSSTPDGEPSAPEGPFADRTFIQAGPLEGEMTASPAAHIFVGSKAPWYTIADDVPQHDAYEPGVEAKVLPPLPRPPAGESGAVRGSCLCGATRYESRGALLRVRYCHCSRCRRARAAAHATNLFVSIDGFRYVAGEENLDSYKVPDARFFMQVFCRTCGSPMPRVDRDRGFAVVPMGSLDDDPGLAPECHIFVGSKAPWLTIAGEIPCYEAAPPA